MKWQYWLLAGFFFLSSEIAQAQADIHFEKKEHNFGQVSEEGGPITHQFTFTNTGEAPLIISNVKASCGCTTPSWTREPVAPGEQGAIEAQYNPKNRPGAFKKSITVTSNATPPTQILYIQGTVTPKPRDPASDFPSAMGKLRMKYQSLNMGKILTDKPAVKSFDVYNDSDTTIIFSPINITPGHITVQAEPSELLPHQKGAINVTYDATNAVERKGLGFSTDHIQLFTNEPEDSIKRFTVMATVEEHFAPLNKEALAEAPVITFSKKTHDFGTLKEGTVAKTEFTVTNRGKTPLTIRDTKANCGCTVSTLQKETLEPGESSLLEVTFNTHGRRGRQQKTVTVFSNDPKNPAQQLILKAEVAVSKAGK